MNIKHLLAFCALCFSVQPIFCQHDSLFHNYQFGIKFGGAYTLTDTRIDDRPSTFINNQEIIHQAGIAENDYGYNIGIFGLVKVNDWLNLQAELDFMRIRGSFAYNTSTRLGEIGTIENTYTNNSEEILANGTGVYELREVFFQVPVMAKILVGKDWKFALGAGVYFRGGGFSNSSWTFDKRKYFREIQETWAPEDPPLVTNNIVEKQKLIKDTNFGFIADLGIIRPISKTQSLFLEFRYQQPFSEESEIPYLKQKTLVASIGFMTKIMRPSEKDEFTPDDGFEDDEEIKKMKRKKKREEKDDF